MKDDILEGDAMDRRFIHKISDLLQNSPVRVRSKMDGGEYSVRKSAADNMKTASELSEFDIFD
ncbi:hypothetical protein Lal_00000474 [Lupinus albus]|nr:hypothetical protein Lal_00000474 [Lupinus albus]